MNLTFAAQLNKMITAGLGGAVEAPETGVAVGRRTEYTSIGPAPILTFDANSELPIKALSVNIEPIQEGTGDPSPENVRPISGRSTVNVWRETTYDTSAEPALTIQLGQTVYGGTVDVVSGEMVVDRAMVDLGTLTWRYRGEIRTGIFSSNTDGVVDYLFSKNVKVMCSKYKYMGTVGGVSGMINHSDEIAVYYGNDNAHVIYVIDARYNNLTDFMTAIQGVQLCYELAQPITITLTPEQLTTVLGTNNVWSDADEVSLTYGNIYYTEGY